MAVGLSLPGLGGPNVEPVVRVGDSQSPGADQEGCANDQAERERRDRRGFNERHERALRGDQRQAPLDQAARLRLPQPRAVRNAICVYLGRARPRPGRTGRAHEFLKRRFFGGPRRDRTSDTLTKRSVSADPPASDGVQRCILLRNSRTFASRGVQGPRGRPLRRVSLGPSVRKFRGRSCRIARVRSP